METMATIKNQADRSSGVNGFELVNQRVNEKNVAGPDDRVNQ